MKKFFKVNKGAFAKYLTLYVVVTALTVSVTQWMLQLAIDSYPSLRFISSYNGLLFTGISTIIVAILFNKFQSNLMEQTADRSKLHDHQSFRVHTSSDSSLPEEAQGSMKDTSQLVSQITDKLPAFSFRLDEQGTFLEMEGKGLAKLDLQDNELVGENIFTHYPDIGPYIKDALNGQVVNFIGNGLKNGEPWWFKNYVFPDRFRKKGVIGFAIDITELKLAEKETRQSKQLYKKVLQNLPKTGILLFDTEYRLHMVEGNTFLTEFKEPDSKDMVGKTINDLHLDNIYDPVPGQKIQQFFDMALNGENKNVEDVFAGRHYAIHITSLKEDDDKVDYGIILMQDITDIKDVESRLLKAYLEGQDWERQRIAEKLQEGPSEELYGAQMQLQSLAKDLQKLPYHKRASFEVVNNTLEKATQEVRKISHSLMPDVLSDFGFTTALHSLLRQYRKEQNCRVNYYTNVRSLDLPKNLEVGIYQVIKELLYNSIEHLHAKSVEISLTRRLYGLEVSLTDDGDWSKANSKFDNSRELSNIQARVKALKGLFELHEHSGNGSKAIIEIPIEESYDEDKSFTG